MTAKLNKATNIKGTRPTIPEYFRGKTIFITGGTGFLGKVLIEKLLRSCSELKKIYVVCRGRKTDTYKQRMDKILEEPLFDLVRGRKHKVVAMEGNVEQDGLGLSEEDKQTLFKETEIVFHGAASVRFDLSLKKSIITNVIGSYNLILLMKQMTNLKSCVHISTTYCQSDKKVVEEKIYPGPADWQNMIKLATNMEEHQLDVFCKKILDRHINTYTFTKAITENMFDDHKDVIPGLIIFRPSVVTPTMVEPVPGWIDNFNGPAALSLAVGKGIVKSAYLRPHVKVDMIPVDVVTQALIASVWSLATSTPTTKITVINASSSNLNRTTQGDIIVVGAKALDEIPFQQTLWAPGVNGTSIWLLHFITVMLAQVIPALVIDQVLKWNNQKPMLAKIQRKIFVATHELIYFTMNEWDFKNKNSIDLFSNLEPDDNESFNCLHLADYDEFEYAKKTIVGARKYLLHEDMSTLEEDKKRQRMLKRLDQLLKIVLIVLTSYGFVKFGLLSFCSSVVTHTATTLFT